MFVLTNYKHKQYDLHKLMNKELFPQTSFSWDQYEEFNEIYQFCLDNFMLGEKTKSGGLAGGPKNRYHNIYFYNVTKGSIELIIASPEYGCYKFVVKNKKSQENTVGGKKAVKEIFKLAEDFNLLHVFKDEFVDKETGMQYKKEIERPIIQVVSDIYKGREFEHCYHVDANSSYFSRICEWKPELKPLGEYLIEHRKENNNYYKHIMTNATGCMQSDYCPDINSDYYKYSSPYALANFSKHAINGTNLFIKDLYYKLEMNGFEPLLINTDGIWYRDRLNKNRCYHDDNEGTGLGQWKNDHKDVKLYIKSAGAYQYIEDGKVKTVLRSTCMLDRIKPDRDTWNWREIADQTIFEYKFDEKRGIIITNE